MAPGFLEVAQHQLVWTIKPKFVKFLSHQNLLAYGTSGILLDLLVYHVHKMVV